MNWEFIIVFGTVIFWAALHQWPPDGRRWQRDEGSPADPPPGPHGDELPEPRADDR